MARVFKRIILTLLLVFVGYVVTVQVLRWLAFGDEEREALALMERPLPVPEGVGGYKYLAFPDIAVPPGELDAAMAAAVAERRDRRASTADPAVGEPGGDVPARPGPPYPRLAARYPARAAIQVPDPACRFREFDCLGKLHGNEAAMRDWLATEADRIALAKQALKADHLANPHALAFDAPSASFQMLRLAFNDVALQALEGDRADALVQACGMLEAERRFLRQGGLLLDKMVHAAFTQGIAGLVLGIRQADPGAPLPVDCGTALAPVDAADYLACDALRAEFIALDEGMQTINAGLRESRHPLHWGSRLLFVDDRLQRGWNARIYAPLCRDGNRQDIMDGRVPDMSLPTYSMMSRDYWAAPVSYTLFHISNMDYGRYQLDLLDAAAVLRLQLAAIAHINGEITAAQVPDVAASPGYLLSQQDGDWVLVLRGRLGRDAPSEFRVRLAGDDADAGGVER